MRELHRRTRYHPSEHVAVQNILQIVSFKNILVFRRYLYLVIRFKLLAVLLVKNYIDLICSININIIPVSKSYIGELNTILLNMLQG